MDLFYDYRTNLPLYPTVQAYFRKYQPPTLIVWGKNDKIFPATAHIHTSATSGSSSSTLSTRDISRWRIGRIKWCP